MYAMHLPSQRFLKLLVLLLVTVFMTETVYASSMMSEAQLHHLNYKEKSHTAEHTHHDAVHQQKATTLKHQQHVNDNCTKCGHCIACFSVLPTNQQSQISLTPQYSFVGLFIADYRSHISYPLQKPPIFSIIVA